MVKVSIEDMDFKNGFHTKLDVNDGEQLWFRGVKSESYALEPSLLREARGRSTLLRLPRSIRSHQES